MDQEKWDKLRTERAIEVIARHVCDMIAKEIIAQGLQMGLEHQRGEALVALEKLGYIVISKEIKALKYVPCVRVYKSQECGYRGNMEGCDKTIGACRKRGNEKRFTGFPIPEGGF